MMDSGNKFDPELFRARWVLGGVRSEDMPEEAASALASGFNGPALRQLACLVNPTREDVGNLPDRAFTDLGLKEMSQDDAVTFLTARGVPFSDLVLPELLEAFPAFSGRWRAHVKLWCGKAAGSYNDMAEFVHFVVQDIYEKGNRNETLRAFTLLEELLANGDQATRDLLGLGFFETLRNVTSWRPYGSKAFEPFLGPLSAKAWSQIERMWKGKSSLVDVIRSER
jgi:hypothetical protein